MMFKRNKKSFICMILVFVLLFASITSVYADEDDPINPPDTEITPVEEDPDPTATDIPEPTEEPDPTATNTPIPTDTPVPTKEPIATEVPATNTPVPTKTADPTAAPVQTPAVNDPTPESTVAPEQPEVTITPEVVATPEPESTATPEPTQGANNADPTAAPDANATPEPTITEEITVTPTPIPYVTVVPPALQEEYPKPNSTSDKVIEVKSPAVVKIDGIYDEVWDDIEACPIENVAWGKNGASGSFKTFWDKEYLYILVDVTDKTPDTESPMFSRQDCVEIFFNETNDKPEMYGDSDSHYKINRVGEIEYGCNGSADVFDYKVIEKEDGYIIEAAITFVLTNPSYGQKVGFDVRVNDSKRDQYRDYMIQWSDTSMYTFSDLSKIGTIVLK